MNHLQPDWFNMIAATRGKPAGWSWFHSEWRGEVMIVKGGVAGHIYKSGPNKGKPNPKKRTEVSEISVSREDLNAIKATWEASSGKCSACYGDGRTVTGIAMVNGETTRSYRDCKKCQATGSAAAP